LYITHLSIELLHTLQQLLTTAAIIQHFGQPAKQFLKEFTIFDLRMTIRFTAGNSEDEMTGSGRLQRPNFRERKDLAKEKVGNGNVLPLDATP